MTKTGLQSRELAFKAAEAEKDRALKRGEGRKDRAAKYFGDGLKAVTSIGSKFFKNDPTWYKTYIPNLDQFTNLPTFDRTGNTRYGSVWSYAGKEMTVPGIMVINWVPSIGNQISSADPRFFPINQILMRAKEQVLKLNSRSRVEWEPSDLGYNILATADVYCRLLSLRRAIQAYNTYIAQNSYMAESLVNAMGYSFSDMQDNIAEYRKQYCILSARFNSALVAPANVTLYKRRAFLSSNVFADCEGTVRQVYLYKQTHMLMLADDVTTLECVAIDNQNIKIIVSQIQTAISRLAENPDFIEMYADLRHAFGDNIIQLPIELDQSPITFNTDKLNRAQIHNICTLPIFHGMAISRPEIDPLYWGCKQDLNGYLYQGKDLTALSLRRITYAQQQGEELPFIEAKNKYNDHIEFLNSYNDVVSGDEIIDVTRMRCSLETQPQLNGYIINVCGTEVPTYLTVYSNLFNGVSRQFQSDVTLLSTFTYVTESAIMGASGILDEFNLVTPFDWHPTLNAFDAGATKRYNLCDYNHAYGISEPDLIKIHDAAVMGEFYLPDSLFRGK